MAERIARFSDFWPYYLGEHRNATCRRLHFVGTTTWLALFVSAVRANLALDASRLAIGLGVFFAALAVGFVMEAKRNPIPAMLVALVALIWTDPVRFPLAMVFAYGFAWGGHFLIEKNRPATFTYPIWSLFADHVMFARMLTGKLWSGDSLPSSSPQATTV